MLHDLLGLNMSKSFVTIEKCIICSEDTGNLLMDRRLKRDANGEVKTRDTFEMYTAFPTSVCPKCRKKHLSHGTMVINPDTGDLVVLKDEAFKRIFDKPIPSQKIAFCDESVIKFLQKGGE